MKSNNYGTADLAPMHSRRGRLRRQSVQRPLFSWKHRRKLLDVRWVHFNLFLLFWILTLCYHNLYYSTCIWAPTKGLKIEAHQFLGFADAFPVRAGEVSVHPVIVECAQKRRGSSKHADLVCIDICQYSEIYVSGNRVSGDRLSAVLREVCTDQSGLRIVVHSHPASKYGEFVFVMDELFQIRDDSRSPPMRLLILPPGSNPELTCNDIGLETIFYYSEVDETEMSGSPDSSLKGN